MNLNPYSAERPAGSAEPRDPSAVLLMLFVGFAGQNDLSGAVTFEGPIGFLALVALVLAATRQRS